MLERSFGGVAYTGEGVGSGTYCSAGTGGLRRCPPGGGAGKGLTIRVTRICGVARNGVRQRQVRFAALPGARKGTGSGGRRGLPDWWIDPVGGAAHADQARGRRTLRR